MSENVLTVNRFIESDAGMYKCSLVDSSTGTTLNKKEFNLACEYTKFLIIPIISIDKRVADKSLIN